MIRKLLACLALLTGLAAAGTPAQAEVTMALASRIEASAVNDSVTASAIAPTAALPRKAEPAIAAAPELAFDDSALQPSVRLGSDRARE
jgi:hypothetical protein